MKKHVIRREFLKLKISSKSYKECRIILESKFKKKLGLRTLKYWWKRFNGDDQWDLRDIPQRPKKLQVKFSEEERETVINLRKSQIYSAYQLRIKLKEKGITMSEATIKRIIRKSGLSRGNKMEGMRLSWVFFERPDPNYMWQIDGTQLGDGRWILPVIDDHSRYCIAVIVCDSMDTETVTKFLEQCIAQHGKPRQILTDNGSEFGGPRGWDSMFDKWCEKQGIEHLRSRVREPTTVGKVSAIQQTIMRELPACNYDLEKWRMRYNHERPHRSLHGLTPAIVYFQFKRHKKHYEL